MAAINQDNQKEESDEESNQTANPRKLFKSSVQAYANSRWMGTCVCGFGYLYEGSRRGPLTSTPKVFATRWENEMETRTSICNPSFWPLFALSARI
jgi:hypothetical protein